MTLAMMFVGLVLASVVVLGCSERHDADPSLTEANARAQLERGLPRHPHRRQL